MKPAAAILERTRSLLEAKGAGERIEVTEKRTPNSKTFDLGNGQFHVSERLHPVHYEDKGELHEIDTAIKNNAVVGAPYKARLLANAIGYRYESRKGGWMEMELVTLDGQKVKAPKPRIDDDTAYWDDIAPGVSMYFKAFTTHPEIFKIYASPHETVWKVTQSNDFKGQFNPSTRGKDAAGDNLEILTTYLDGTFTETWTGRVSRIPEGEKARRKKAWFDNPALPVVVDAGITENIGTEADDVFSYFTQFTSTTVPTSGLSGTATGAGGIIHVDAKFYQGTSVYSRRRPGLRFQAIALPAGATISSAVITVNLKSEGGGLVTRIYADDVDNAAAFGVGRWPKDITKTTAFYDWTPAVLPGGEPINLRSIDVTALVAEVAARPGWLSNNAMAFAGFPQPGTGSRRLAFEAYENSGTDEAQLDITYTVGAAPVATLSSRSAGAGGHARGHARGRRGRRG